MRSFVQDRDRYGPGEGSPISAWRARVSEQRQRGFPLGKGLSALLPRRNIGILDSFLKTLSRCNLELVRDPLLDAVTALASARDEASVCVIVRQAARALTEADGVTFVLRQGNHCYYADEDAIAPLWKGKRFPLESCISGWAMLNRQHVVVPDIYSDERIPHDAYRPTFVKSLVDDAGAA